MGTSELFDLVRSESAGSPKHERMPLEAQVTLIRPPSVEVNSL